MLKSKLIFGNIQGNQITVLEVITLIQFTKKAFTLVLYIAGYFIG